VTRLALLLCLALALPTLLGACRCDRKPPPRGPVIDLRSDAGAR
jgi:hypothetical protein